jgi:ABC-2 type transport system permease protein
MSLARAELRRLFKRRFTRWMLVFVVLVLGAIVAGIAASNHAPDSAAVAVAQEQAQRHYEDMLRQVERDVAECERAQAAGEEDPAAGGRIWPDDCDEMRQWMAGPDEMTEWFMPPTFEFRTDFEALITVFTGILALFAFIVGASFVGAEWRSGGMMNLLLWRPRRLQVLATKLVTLVAALAGLVVLLGGVWTASFWQVATYRGITDTMTSGAWQSLGLTGLRGAALVLAAGAIGFAVSSLGRHTATALGAAIAAFIVGVLGAQIVAFAVGARYPQAWVWTSYLQAWMHRSVTFHDFRGCDWSAGPGPCEPATMEVTWQTAGIGILAVVALLVGAAMWHMRRRDVT